MAHHSHDLLRRPSLFDKQACSRVPKAMEGIARLLAGLAGINHAKFPKKRAPALTVKVRPRNDAACLRRKHQFKRGVGATKLPFLESFHNHRREGHVAPSSSGFWWTHLVAKIGALANADDAIGKVHMLPSE